MADLADISLASPAPVFSVDSRFQGALARDLLRLDVEEGRLGLRTLVAHLHAIGPTSDGSSDQLQYLDGEIILLGSRLDVTIGPPGGERRLFSGTVSAVEVNFAEGAAPYVSVFAEDALMRLRMAERTTTFRDVTDAEIVEQVGARHGLAVEADVRGPRYPLIHQWEESDLAVVRDCAARVNAELWVVDDVLHFADRTARPGAELTLVQGNDLISLTARADLAHQRSTVEYRGWDDRRVEAVSEAASADVVRAEVVGGRLGPEIVGDVFDSAATSRSRADTVSPEVADAYARGEMLRRGRRFATVDGTTRGTPDLVPGAHLDLRRVGHAFDGTGYRVVHARHSYDQVTGYRTAFRAERPWVASS